MGGGWEAWVRGAVKVYRFISARAQHTHLGRAPPFGIFPVNEGGGWHLMGSSFDPRKPEWLERGNKLEFLSLEFWIGLKGHIRSNSTKILITLRNSIQSDSE